MQLLGLLATIGSMFLVYRMIFKDFEELMESVRFWLTPDCISFMRGEGFQDYLAELKLIFLIFYGVLVYAGVKSIGL